MSVCYVQEWVELRHSECVVLGTLHRQCVHVGIQLHLILQDLKKLLHGGKMTRFQLRPHRDVCAHAHTHSQVMPQSCDCSAHTHGLVTHRLVKSRRLQ